MILNRNTTIKGQFENPIGLAVQNLKRDILKVCAETQEPGGEICLKNIPHPKECFTLLQEESVLNICASDELGFIYGLYEISRVWLGINEFWFWNDQKVKQRKHIEIPDGYGFVSKPSAIKYRGWFINDEVLLHTWSVENNPDKPWEMVMEALLRCGGNLVIPGTDKNAEKYRTLAANMGLYITHHHAEPLGARMFARAYPGLNPSYAEYPDKFQKLWTEGIDKQKDDKVVWNLGFRGQGDCPFWENDKCYQTPMARGELISQIIRMQYDMVKKKRPEDVCCTNLYGETMELYRDGFLKLPEDVIKIWADNGYGKMVTRRQENHNPRIPALPEKNDKGCNGIYYHASFYDLQAANHMIMLPNAPEFIYKELQTVIEHGATDYWLINCSNVKPHVYILDLIAAIWRDKSVNIDNHRKAYTQKYYGSADAELVSSILAEFPKYSVAYGSHEDEHAGDQFPNHVARMLITQFVQDRNGRAENLLWATDAETLEEQIIWYKNLCEQGRGNYQKYFLRCEGTDSVLTNEARTLYRDTIMLQVKILRYCFTGAYKVCLSLLEAMEGNYQKAFYFAGCSRKEYLKADQCMREREHGKWHGFYANECLTDMKQTAWVLESLMGYLRTLGDGPHYYQWQREFLYSEEDRKVMLIMNMENHLKDQELFELMEKKWG